MSSQPTGENRIGEDPRPPDVLTVPEAGRILRLGKSAAYEHANRWIDTDGAEGMPAKRIGRALRVPTQMLAEFLGGPVTWPPPPEVVELAPEQSEVKDETSKREAKERRDRRRRDRRRRPPNDDQNELPFSA